MSTSTNISNVNYTYPIPKDLKLEGNQTISSINNEYKNIFEKHKTSYFNILIGLKSIFKANPQSATNISHISISDIITGDASNDSDAANNAYKFYGCKIIDQLNRLGSCINKANEIINNLKEFQGTSQQLINQAHSDFVNLECLNTFCSEITDAFGTRYEYDYEEELFKPIIDDYQHNNEYSQLENKYSNFSEIRETKVKYHKKGSYGSKKPLDCYNELNLLDRLKYIKVYYDIQGKKSDYVFPEKKEIGYPCVKEDTSKDARIGQLEKFFLGYLIDRDGPINAFSSFFEIKTTALKISINLLQERIKALNAYLMFVNRGFQLLTSSQSNAKDAEYKDNGTPKDKNKDTQYRIPDAAWIALTYICGRNMYNLYSHKTTSNGKEIEEKYLVLPHGSEKDNFTSFILVKADEDGMRFLLGDQFLESEKNSNGCLYVNTEKETVYLRDKKNEEILPSMYMYSRDKSKETHEYNGIPLPSNEFKLPARLEVEPIAPNSVLQYENFTDRSKIKTNVVTSWTDAFQKKTQYLDTAIEEVKTDIELLRSKINSFDSLCSKLRSRVQDIYLNTVKHTKQ